MTSCELNFVISDFIPSMSVVQEQGGTDGPCGGEPGVGGELSGSVSDGVDWFWFGGGASGCVLVDSGAAFVVGGLDGNSGPELGDEFVGGGPTGGLDGGV